MSVEVQIPVGRRVYAAHGGYTIEVFNGPDGKALIKRTGGLQECWQNGERHCLDGPWSPIEWSSPDLTAEEWVIRNMGGAKYLLRVEKTEDKLLDISEIPYAYNGYKSSVAEAEGFVSGTRLNNLRESERRLRELLWENRDEIVARKWGDREKILFRFYF